jgi:PPOX class probable F420-dependent enzyme
MNGPEVPAGPRRREHVRMSPAEVAAYLGGPHTMIVATNGTGGFPHQVAVFYVMDGDNPVFWSYRKAQKIVNLQRDPRVSCLVETGTDHRELRGVLLTGRAHVCADPAVIERTWRWLTEKYSGPVTPADLANFQRQADKRCVVTVTAADVLSWDHSKMSAERH